MIKQLLEHQNNFLARKAKEKEKNHKDESSSDEKTH